MKDKHLRNLMKRYHKDCMCIPCTEFENIICELFNEEVGINYDLEDSGWYPTSDDDDKEVTEEDVIEKLEEFFDIKISSIHTDAYSPCCFWIAYEVKK